MYRYLLKIFCIQCYSSTSSVSLQMVDGMSSRSVLMDPRTSISSGKATKTASAAWMVSAGGNVCHEISASHIRSAAWCWKLTEPFFVLQLSFGWAWRTSTLSQNMASTSCRWSCLIGRDSSCPWPDIDSNLTENRRCLRCTWRMSPHPMLRRK